MTTAQWIGIDYVFRATDARRWAEIDQQELQGMAEYTGLGFDQCPETARWSQRERPEQAGGYGSRGGRTAELMAKGKRLRRAENAARRRTKAAAESRNGAIPAIIGDVSPLQTG